MAERHSHHGALLVGKCLHAHSNGAQAQPMSAHTSTKILAGGGALTWGPAGCKHALPHPSTVPFACSLVQCRFHCSLDHHCMHSCAPDWKPFGSNIQRVNVKNG